MFVVSLCVYFHTGLSNIPYDGRNRTYDLWNAILNLSLQNYAVRCDRYIEPTCSRSPVNSKSRGFDFQLARCGYVLRIPQIILSFKILKFFETFLSGPGADCSKQLA